MSLISPSAGLLAASLVAAGVALPLAAAAPASAACLAGTVYQITEHQRTHLKVGGTTIKFTKPGTHTVEITKKGLLTAKYGTGDVDDQLGIKKAVQAKWPKVKNAVHVTKGHKKTFKTGSDERVTVSYASYGDQVKWAKVAVKSNCSTTVLDSGTAKFPRRNLDWLFAIAIS